MVEIKVNEPITIGDKQVDKVEVQPVFYAAFADIYATASAKMTKGTKIQTLITRERIRAQAHFIAGGKRIKPEDKDILTFPIAFARELLAALDEGQGVEGEILTAGDGISTPILYKLGTPIPMGGTGAKAITELEFIAKSYGDVEDVLTADNSLAQTLELVRKVAKAPEFPSLSVLPSGVVDRITMGDGMTMTRLILPGFLG